MDFNKEEVGKDECITTKSDACWIEQFYLYMFCLNTENGYYYKPPVLIYFFILISR